MRCSKCGSDNRQGRKFCTNCGTSLVATCPKCGAAIQLEEKFCGECGAAIGASVPPVPSSAQPSPLQLSDAISATEVIDGERKTVTALFANIKGSMELMEDLDPEEARAMVDPALKLMIEAVQHYDGYIVQSTGDGIFALFGAPVAHEDHPQRALHAALRMQEELRRYSARLVAEGGTPIETRIGVNTGEVVVRALETGAGHVEYTPIGHTTNLAARLQTVAPTRSIAISEQTRKLVEGYFQLKALGPTKVKGVSEPVNVYEVTGLGPLRTRLQRAARRGLSKFVGRAAEMEAMRHALELAKMGRGQIVAAVGEPGVGKSRLFFEFKARSRSGCLVLETFSVSHGKASAYLPVIELLKNYFEIEAEDDDRKRREKVNGKVLTLDRSLEDTLPHLFSLLGIAESPSGRAETLAGMIAMDRQTQRLRDAVKRLLLRESLAQPVIIEVEDLHWIDGETQGLLNLLADSIASARVLMLVNYRPEYAHQWGSKTYYTQLRLDPLGRKSADEMLSALLGDGENLLPLKRLIIDRTEGNPFFMEEIKEALFDQGVLARNGGIKLAKPVTEVRLPPTVQGVLASRIDRLGREEKELLQALAVIGKEFPLRLIRKVGGSADDDLERMLSELQVAEFIYEQPAVSDPEYTFKHALTQEVAYGLLLNERRKELHRRIAASIETLYGERLEDHYGELAHHYSRAGESAKAVHYLGLAGEQAFVRSAYAEAIANLTTGLELLQTLSESPVRNQQELRMRLTLASALFVVTGPASNEAAASFSRAYELCRRGDESSDLILALVGLTRVHLFRGGVHKAREASEETLQAAGTIQDAATVATAHCTQGMVLHFLGELAQARERLEQALAMFNSISVPSGSMSRVIALLYLGRTLWLLGFPDQALERTRETEIAGQRSTDPVAKGFGLALTLEVHAWCGNFDVVREHAQTFLDAPWTTELNPGFRSDTVLFRGWLMAREGQPKGITLIRNAIATRAVFRLYRALYGALLVEACVSLGRLDDAMSALDETLPFADTEEHYYEAELHRLRGELLLGRTVADREDAERCFRKAIDIARRQGAKSWELRATKSLARLLRDAGRRDEARVMLAEIYNWFTEGFETADLKSAKALLDELSE
ncbi:MAG: AAA family ATPase [Deltaproteobacteria bacterium]|nr:AAA family ATPase [Deltaproteobacteria bacterium]